MTPTTPYVGRCSCKCACFHNPEPHCYGLCEPCFLDWCEASDAHAPIADNSYLGTYGINNIWTGWLISRAPDLVAETPHALLRPEPTPACPLCREPMARRPGAWKCYNPAHHEPVVILERPNLPRSPRLNALGVCLP
jgi:hypothetical protein